MQCWLFYAFSSRQIDYKNTHGLALEALEGRGIGVAGKQVIHPSQIGGVQASATRKGTACPCRILGTSAPLLCGALCWVRAAHYLIPFWANPLPLQEAFSPDPHDVEEAGELVAAFERHQQEGTGAFTFK